MNELLIVLLGLLLIGVSAYVIVRLGSRSARSPGPTERPAPSGQVEVILPVDDAEPESKATQRLVADAAHRVLAHAPEVATVVVLSRGGSVLGRVERRVPLPARPFVDVPIALREPHAPRHAGPGEPVGSERVVHAPAHVRFEEAPSWPHKSLAEHFELPDGVMSRIGNHEDPVEIVRAIIEESGARAGADGDVFRRGDRVLIVLHTPLHAAVEPPTLNAAFLRFQASGAKRGMVLTAGALPVHDVRRREALAPDLLHAGPDGIQRMADAVAVGADPLDFVVPPG